MAECIERAAAVRVVLRQRQPANSVAQNRMLSIIQRDLLTTPAADVAPVVHGRWEWLGPNGLVADCMCGTCSACKVRSEYIVNTMLCPPTAGRRWTEKTGTMRDEDLLAALRRLKVETGSLVCVGCGYEHNCGIHGCAILREMIAWLERTLAEGRPSSVMEYRDER